MCKSVDPLYSFPPPHPRPRWPDLVTHPPIALVSFAMPSKPNPLPAITFPVHPPHSAPQHHQGMGPRHWPCTTHHRERPRHLCHSNRHRAQRRIRHKWRSGGRGAHLLHQIVRPPPMLSSVFLYVCVCARVRVRPASRYTHFCLHTRHLLPVSCDQCGAVSDGTLSAHRVLRDLVGSRSRHIRAPRPEADRSSH